ncbi:MULTISPECIES: DUF418 domain-containing protein [Lysinibacillus]|uniref:DUF418 domain-containing protein n=1 Tax=Lysinibacillus TaxID=400634 RepID=UPI000B01AD04|nr:DUF418 domain-containing protein [Lysinibacillus xylanilyticus]
MMGVKRVSFIDSLRGFSLLGILLANLVVFQYGMHGALKNLSSQSAGDFVKVFIGGSFMPIFTLLFGFSFIKLIESVREKGLKSRWIILRRSLGLILLGWLHTTFIWEGDILLFYGIMILFLLPFINRKVKTIIIWASIFFVFSVAFMMNINLNFTANQQEIDVYIEKANNVYANGSYLDVVNHRLNRLMPEQEGSILLLVAPLFYVPLFLLGMALAKMRAFENMEREQKWYRLGLILVPIGVLCKYSSLKEGDLSTMLQMSGAQVLALGYVCVAALLYKKWCTSSFIYAFECVGKLSLTNYLMQSIICTTVFFGYGFGLYGKLGILNGMLFGLVVYSAQCIGSVLYFKRFKRGPFEQALRMWTNWSLDGRLKQKVQNINNIIE